jgi:hypothetical protein
MSKMGDNSIPDTSKRKYTNTISFTDKTCAISDIDDINMIPDQHIIFLDISQLTCLLSL